LADVNVAEISEIWHHTFTIEYRADGEHCFQYFGPELIHVLGEDVTGWQVDEAMNHSMLGNLIGFFEKIIVQRTPVSESSQFYMEGKEIRYRSLIVPLSSNGKDIDYLIGTTNYKAYD
jgi:hypothetical protein